MSLFFNYEFKFKDNAKKTFSISLNKHNLNLIKKSKNNLPKWTRLKNSQCPNCKLEPKKNKYCPIAGNIVGLIDFFQNSISFEEVKITIKTETRTYLKDTTLQKGISSILGIYMVTSGCPIMDKLKPMVCHHLPFATIEETRYRVMSMYLLAQYLKTLKGKRPDWKLKGLIGIYDDIKILNHAFCERLKALKLEDASTNAIVILNCFANFVPFSINEQLLEEMENIFQAYL
jgi:hypothetical protein